MNAFRRAAAALAGACIATQLTGCSTDKPMTLNSNLNGDMKLGGDMKLSGDMKAGLSVEGPIQISMQLQGPTIKYEGTYISDELFEVVKTGKTTDDWILAVFGEPTAQAALKDGTSIWRWTYRPTMQEAAVIEVFADEKKQPKLATRTVFVQLREGVVIEKWKG
jgi:hypothetical protein